jgi:hypothetical protein
VRKGGGKQSERRKKDSQFRHRIRKGTYLGKSGFLASTEIRARGFVPVEQRLDFLDEDGDQILGRSILSIGLLGAPAGEDLREGLGDEGVDEEAQARAEQCVALGRGCGKQMLGRMCVGQELGHHRRFRDDVAVVLDAGDQAALRVGVGER